MAELISCVTGNGYAYYWMYWGMLLKSKAAYLVTAQWRTLERCSHNVAVFWKISLSNLSRLQVKSYVLLFFSFSRAWLRKKETNEQTNKISIVLNILVINWTLIFSAKERRCGSVNLRTKLLYLVCVPHLLSFAEKITVRLITKMFCTIEIFCFVCLFLLSSALSTVTLLQY